MQRFMLITEPLKFTFLDYIIIINNITTIGWSLNILYSDLRLWIIHI